MFKKNIFESFVKKEISKEDAVENHDSLKYLESKSEEKIFDFQEEKEKLISKMHELIKTADDGGEVFLDEKDLISVGLNNDGSITTFGKKSGEITKGDIAVASIWGKNIKLNSEIDRKTKKEFILRETKRKINELWNKQLSEAVKSSRETSHIKSIEGLEKTSELDEEKKYEKMKAGHLAEKIFESFFTKLSVNNSEELPFEIEVGDVYDDAIKKIDFIFHIKKEYTRAINIESCDDCNKNDIGVQYTMNTDAQEKKEGQIEKQKKEGLYVDDLVLVSLPLGNLTESMNEWLDNKKRRDNFSGPEEYLPLEIKEKLFKSVLEKLPSYLEVDNNNYWEKIKNQV